MTGEGRVVKGRFLVKLALRGLLALLLLLLLLGGMVWYYDPFRLFAPVPYDVTASPMSLIRPGTVVGDTAPDGWTHLILKSHPRVASGAVARLSETEVRFATFLFFTTLARVEPPSGARTTYVLDDVAIGLGTQIDGKDVVLSPDTQAKLGANLGLLFSLILRGAYDRQKTVRVVARSPTFALLDTPSLMLRHGKHVDVTVRYAVLVEPQSGRLDTLAWLIDRAEEPDRAIGPAEWLPPSLVGRPPLHIDDREFFLGHPTEKAYGVEGMPPGQKKLDLPDDLARLAGQPRFTETEARHLHDGLRRLLR